MAVVVAPEHRREVLERARAAAAWRGRPAVLELLGLLHSEFGPSELHTATPGGFLAVCASAHPAADLSLIANVVEHRRTTVGDGRLGASTCLACPVLVGGRVVGVVAVSREDGWDPALATLADGVVALGTPCLANEQRRIQAASTADAAGSTERVRRLVHDDAVQVLTAVAERLDLVRTGVLPEQELVSLPTELRETAARLAAGVGPGTASL